MSSVVASSWPHPGRPITPTLFSLIPPSTLCILFLCPPPLRSSLPSPPTLPTSPLSSSAVVHLTIALS